MATIQEFILRFKTEGTSNIKALKDDIKDLTNNANPLNSSLGNLAGRMGPLAAGAAAAAGAFAVLGMRAMDLGDQLDDISNATGIAAGQLVNLRSSLINAGGDADSFSKFASKLSIAVGESASGNEKYQKSFKDLGVFITDAGGKVRDTGDILEDVLAGLANTDPAIRQAKAVEILGKEAAKIDWSNVRAGRDIEFDAASKNLAHLRGQIDALRVSIDEGLLRAFGNLAKGYNEFGIDNVFARMTEGAAGALEKIPLLGSAFEFLNKKARESRQATEAQISASKQEADAEIKRLQARAQAAGATGRPGPTKVPGGGQGATPEATLKAIQESRNRIELSGIEARKQAELKSADEISKIQITARYEIEKVKAEITAKERLNEAQKNAEIAAKRLEIETKAENDIAKIREQQTQQVLQQKLGYQNELAKMLGYEQTETQKVNDLIAQQPDKYKEIGNQLRENAAIQDRNLSYIKQITEEQAKYKQLLNDGLTLGINYRYEVTKINLEEERATRLRQASNSTQKAAINEDIDRRLRLSEITKQLLNEEKLREAALSDLEGDATGQQIALLLDFQEQLRATADLELQLSELRLESAQRTAEQQSTFAYGWNESYKKFKEDAEDAAKQGQQYFDTFSSGVEDAFVKFVQTGKLSFKDLANSIIADFARIQAKKLIVGALDGLFGNQFTPGSSSFVGPMQPGSGRGLFGGKFIPGFLASGGQAFNNSPYIVGERGPELFVPRVNGTVMPNNQIGMGMTQQALTTVNYNIQAVDASSFRSLVARDPQFIYSVTERGRRSQPTRSR
jgi:hypothetical protein